MKFSNDVVLAGEVTYFKFPLILFYCTTELRVHLREPPRSRFYHLYQKEKLPLQGHIRHYQGM